MEKYLIMACLIASICSCAVYSSSDTSRGSITTGQVRWQYFGLDQLDNALTCAQREGKNVLVGICGTITCEGA